MDVYAGGVRNYCRAATLHPDYGPRHLLFDASGTHLYVIGELSGDITVFDYKNGALTEKQVVKADRLDARGAADIHLSPDGKFLYASLRLKGDGIAIFEVAENGTLAYVGYQATGPHPRNFNITPNGRFVLVACRDNDSIEVYSRDAATGLLAPTGYRIPQTRPVFVGW
jgi:6-phosphogluconolactonase (cycloisomerase 2 family)